MKADAVQLGTKWYGVLLEGYTVVWQSKVGHASKETAKNQAAWYRAHAGKSLAGAQRGQAK